MFLAAFLLGLLGSFHCLGMCEPIAFMLPVNRNSKSKKAIQIGIYHIGRFLSYATIGFVFGLIGKGVYLFGLQQKLSIIIGVVMIVITLLPFVLKFKNKASQFGYKLIGKLKSQLGLALKQKTANTFLTIGFLNGFLPCGLVYMAGFSATATSQAWQAALYMVFFGLGTLPLMTVAAYSNQWMSVKTRNKVQKAIPVVVVAIGFLFIVRGMGLNIPYISPALEPQKVSNTINCH